MTQTLTGRPLLSVLNRLDSARQREGLAIVIRAALAGLAAGLVVWILLLFYQIFWPLGPLAAALVAVATGLAVGLALLFHGFGQRRDRIALARGADRFLGTEAGIESAVEMVLHPGRAPVDGSLRQGLLRQVEGLAPQINPGDLAPLPHWRGFVLVLLLAMAAFLLAQTTKDQRAALHDQPPAMLLPEERAPLADRLSNIAAEIENRATEDPYLAAIARELRQLAGDVAGGEAPPRADLVAAVERLANHAARAGAAAPQAARDSSAAEAARLLDDLRRDLAQGPPGAGPTSGAESRDPSGATPADSAENPAIPQGESFPGSGGSVPPATEGTERSEAIRARQPEWQAVPQLDEEICDFETDPDCEVPEFLNARPTAQGDVPTDAMPDRSAEAQIEAGVVIGPSDRAGAGESSEAGRGLADLAAGAAEEAATVTPTEEILLGADNERGEGRRMEIDLAPSEEGEGFPEGGRIGQQNWRRQAEAPVTRWRVPPDLRRARALYFLAPDDWQ